MIEAHFRSWSNREMPTELEIMLGVHLAYDGHQESDVNDPSGSWAYLVVAARC